MNIISTTYFILLCFGCFSFLGVFLFFFLSLLNTKTVYQTDQTCPFPKHDSWEERGRQGDDGFVASFDRLFVCLFIHSFVIGVLG